jgi:catechol 2,3-dioxygenase-like lactoylglutathione lyase family enzyme
MGDQVERAIALAQSKLGAPYVWATAGPDTFDCSGFTWWVACQVLGPQDYELRSSHHQFNVWGDRVWGEPIAGDLVFFDVGQGTIMGNLAGHVGLMIDAEQMIHAANEDLGVRIDRLDADWYAPKFIGARRIFAGDVAEASEPAMQSGVLRVPPGPIRTAMPWNGRPPGADWSNIGRWGRELAASSREQRLDPRLPAAVMALETQGIHTRNGVVIEVWDSHPVDGPSVGLMQVKPWVWQYLVPDADAYDPAGNIRLGVAVLAHLIERYGSWERAIAEGYYPGVSPNGTTPESYVEAMRGLLGELGYAA